MISAAIYCRVSTEEQTNDNQLLECKQFAHNNDLHIFHEYKDVISGASESRTALDQLMKDVFKRKFSTLLISSLDRLGRNEAHHAKIMNQLLARNIRLVSLRENIDTGEWMDAEEKRLMYHIYVALSGWERRRISSRTKAGLQRALNEGKKLGRPKKNLQIPKATEVDYEIS